MQNFLIIHEVSGVPFKIFFLLLASASNVALGVRNETISLLNELGFFQLERKDRTCFPFFFVS